MTAPKNANSPKNNTIDTVKNPGEERYSSAEQIAQLLKQEFENDPHLYLFSPDETTSNKLTAVYDVEKRLWNTLIADWDLPESGNGRIVELLSENVLAAAMIGHLLNGERAFLTSYEAFLPIITSQLIQHCKFLVQSEQANFRPKYPAFNILSTSTCWRQDHNGYSHQSPALISTLLSRPDNKTNCLFPVDDVSATAAFKFMLESQNVVNLTTFNKTKEPRWIDSHHADFQYQNGGASIFDFASDKNPDYILTAAGDIPAREALAAIKLLKKDIPDIKLRFVGLAALSYGAIGTTDNRLPQKTFDDYFTKDKPIIANFHGYPATLKEILSNYTDPARISVHGYEDRGSTTTPYEMLNLNRAARHHLAAEIAAKHGRQDLADKYLHILEENSKYAAEYGVDLVEIYK